MPFPLDDLLQGDKQIAIKVFDSDNNELLTLTNPGVIKITDGNNVININSDGSLDTHLKGAETAVAGKKEVASAGAPEDLGSQKVSDGVYIVANPENTGAVYVFPTGGSKDDVVPLQPGDSDFWPVKNLSALDVDAEVSGEGVYWKGATN